MKIRIRGNSIRFRLTKTEVEQFSKTGEFRETTHFGNSVFTYVIRAKKEISALDADFTGQTLTLYFPEEELGPWTTTDRVGYSHLKNLPEGDTLSLLLEKDFVCLDATVEDQSDNYPNPLAAKRA